MPPAVALFLLLCIIASALLITGVAILSGTGVALIAAAACVAALAALLRKGMVSG